MATIAFGIPVLLLLGTNLQKEQGLLNYKSPTNKKPLQTRLGYNQPGESAFASYILI